MKENLIHVIKHFLLMTKLPHGGANESRHLSLKIQRISLMAEALQTTSNIVNLSNFFLFTRKIIFRMNFRKFLREFLMQDSMPMIHDS